MMGIAVPLFANYMPIREAMSKSLRDSLDIYRKSIDSMTITMTKLENMGISPIQILVGIVMTVFGFIVYYFVPSSILNMRFDLFFFIILAVLFAMVIGMSLISQYFVPHLERMILSLIFIITPSSK
jgi:hypothetical protein